MRMRTEIKWKRSRCVLSTAALLALTAAGCSDKPAQTGASGQPGGTEKRGAVSVSLYDRGTVPGDEGTMGSNRWTRWVQENGPVDVKYVTVPRFESLQKFNVMFASGTAPDLIFEFDTAYHGQLYSQKQLMPLDDLIAAHSTEYKKVLEKYPAIQKAGTMPDGKLYLLGRPMEFGPHHYLLIRADWLKKLNLKLPATPEELLETAKAFAAQDPDANSKQDTQGIGLSFVSGIILQHMFGSGFTLFGTGQYPWTLEEGQVVHDWDRLKASLDFQKQIYDAGIADKDFVTDKNGEKQKQAWITGKLGIYGMNGADVKIQEALKKNVPDAEVIPIALPKTSFGQYSPLLSTPIQMTGMVNAGAKDPESVMKMIDFMVSDAYTGTIMNGLEGTHFKKGASGCPEPIDAEKNKKELGYAGDMNMLAALVGECFGLEIKPSPTPAEKDIIEIRKLAKAAYMDLAKPMVGITHSSYLPSLPQELATINANANKIIIDLAVKSIVSGSSYTVEQFIQEAKAAWEKAGGARVDEFYSRWYAENKDKAILMKDLYQMGGK